MRRLAFRAGAGCFGWLIGITEAKDFLRYVLRRFNALRELRGEPVKLAHVIFEVADEALLDVAPVNVDAAVRRRDRRRCSCDATTQAMECGGKFSPTVGGAHDTYPD